MVWLYFIVLIFSVTFVYAAWRAAPWLPMHAKDVARAIALARLKPGEKFVDIGAGDGRTLLAAAAAGAEAEGCEISLLPYFLAKLKILFFRGSNKPKIFFRDLWQENLGGADAVFVFLMPRIMLKLREKMEKELKPGAKIICYTWPMPGWEPAAVDELPDRAKVILYIR